MDDLRRRFASLDRVPRARLWDTIELRAAALDPVARVTAVVTPAPLRSRRSSRRPLVLLVATAALLVALVAGALAVGSRGRSSGLRSFRSGAWPSVEPSPSASPSLGRTARRRRLHGAAG